MAANGSSHTALEIFSKFRSPPSPCPPFLRGEKFRYCPICGFFPPSAPLRLRAKSPFCFPFAGIVRHSRVQKPRKPLRQDPNPQDHRPRIFFKIPLLSAIRSPLFSHSRPSSVIRGHLRTSASCSAREISLCVASLLRYAPVATLGYTFVFPFGHALSRGCSLPLV